MSPVTYSEIEVVGAVSAGKPTSAGEVEPRCIRVDLSSIAISPTAKTFALLVRGDSMTGAHILDGDTVILEHKPPHHRAIVAAFIDGNFALKRYMEERGRPFLKAENPRYLDIIPAHELVIQGVAVAVLRRL